MGLEVRLRRARSPPPGGSQDSEQHEHKYDDE
jgi:hypothetical protein